MNYDGGLVSAAHSLQLDPGFANPASASNLTYWCQTDDATYGDGDYGTPGWENTACAWPTTEIFSETFDGTAVPTDWTIEDGGTTIDTWYNNGDEMYAYGEGSEDYEEGLITPEIDCTGYTMVLLNYDIDYNYYSGDFVEVQVSTNGIDWTTVRTYNADITATETVDISTEAAGSSTVQVRFYYEANWDYDVSIDNVVVEGM